MTTSSETGSMQVNRLSAILWLTAGLWLFAAGIFTATTIVSLDGEFLPPRLMAWVVLIAISGSLVSLGLYPLVRMLAHWPARARWGALIVSVLVASGGQSLVDGVIHEALDRAFGRAPEPWFHAPVFAVNWLIYVGLFAFYAASLELLAIMERVARHAQESAALAVQVAEAREQARDAQLQMLRFQLNPHFLFNTLNSISSLVVSGRPEMAELMIDRLCQFMRASLKPTGDVLTPLGQELAAMEAYIDIESVRFSDALDIEIDCPTDLDDVLVPSLILQPLVENAIKYALTPSDGASRMRVVVRARGDDLEISVVDEGTARSEDLESGVGIGLENVRRRLAAVYGEAGRLEAGAVGDGFHAQIRLPLKRAVLETAA